MVLYFPSKQFSPRFGDDFFTFNISGYEVVNNDSCCGFASYVVYLIEVQRGKQKWTVKSRFSEMAELHNHLQVTTSMLPITLPSFPPKTLFHVTADSAFLDQRQQALQSYLDELLRRLSEEGGVENTCAAIFLNLSPPEGDNRDEI